MTVSNPAPFPLTPSRLELFPVAFFSIILGLTGVSLAWQKAQILFAFQPDMAGGLRWVALGLFILTTSVYCLKFIRYRDTVIAEFTHPIQVNFFPTISMSLLLLAAAFLPSLPILATGFWLIGTGLHLILTLYIMSVWLHHNKLDIHHINPAWFIPIVGNALVPLAGVPLGYTELSWFFFSIAMLFWLVLLAIIFYRVLFHNPLPDRLMPTFFILIAPPAVGFIAYAQLIGLMQTSDLDAFGRILYYSGLFLTLLLITQAQRFARIQFYLSWWVYSFPLAAITVATIIMFQVTQLTAFAVIAWCLLTFVTLMVVFLLFRTAQAVGAEKICVPQV
ncbi:C4-dicarboxylate ABC transporter [Rhodoferax sp. 4810]|uniref:C4-dicarboxylate ABC transporter n=1 Tax=Thiospirillum jenense TaxID=1653858 RepID=A0A839HCU9_9GAMM|nr:SLAC1 anion channel family protein [Thiospirillum jenense]MBB1073069.1 C4-dicarboxylate ABC transporter [Rhodoferax jenense]MBB1125017.1 C4-dicarboxylate ABC transporter [Thiospirillum jenense]